MKNGFVSFFVLFFSFSAQASDCLPEGITFSSQAQIDAFPANHPGCTYIFGHVKISGSDIVNLSGLSGVTTIRGNLDIVGNASLSDLTGLTSLTSLLGSLNHITSNSALVSLNGLNSLQSISGYLWIQNNDALPDLSGLDSLTSCGPLYIAGNASLVNLNGLNSLYSINGFLQIENNDTLADLGGLQGLAVIYGSLVIIENPSLANCAVPIVCAFLSISSATAAIFANAPGCNTVAEVSEACESISTEEPPRKEILRIYPNPATDSLTVRIPAAPFAGELTIRSTQGRDVLKQTLRQPSTVIDITGLPKGIYFVSLWNQRTLRMQKLIKK